MIFESNIFFMRWLLFINRIALICNLCFILMYVLKIVKGIETYQFFTGTIVTLGYLAILVNFTTILITAIFLILGKRRQITTSLFLVNIVFFLIEFYQFFIAVN